MLKFLAFLALCCSCGPSEPRPSALAGARAPVGQFRGYEMVSQVLRQRLLDPAAPSTDRFEIGIFLGTRDPLGLPALLGGFSGDGGDLAYRGGVPNAMNTAVWYLLAQRIAGQLASLCVTPQGPFGDIYALAPDLAALIQNLCAWPATSDTDLAAYWDRVMGAFAPPEERVHWLAFLASMRDMPHSPDTGQALVKAASETILLHPDFLLAN